MNVETAITELASLYAKTLREKIDARVIEMDGDDNSHYLIYRVLGVTTQEGNLIDVYQNKGRFLYKYAGSFLEEAAILCFEGRFPDAKAKLRIPNAIGTKPKTFEIDCLIGNDAYEVKWKDATTDGDHITKEHTRLRNVQQAGYRPIRVMFYYPHRTQAMRIQETLKTLYEGVGGSYYFGDSAWKHIKEITDIDLKGILERIAQRNTNEQ